MISLYQNGQSCQSYGFSSSHVWMWELDIKKTECWRIDNFEPWCWRRLLRVPWTARRSNLSSECSENQFWTFIGRTDAETNTPTLWPPDEKNWHIGEDPDAGKCWMQEKKGKAEDEMGWMALPTQWPWVWVNSRSWRWTGRPGCCSPWGRKESNMTELGWTGSYLYSPDSSTGIFGISLFLSFIWGFPGGTSGKEPTC